MSIIGRNLGNAHAEKHNGQILEQNRLRPSPCAQM